MMRKKDVWKAALLFTLLLVASCKPKENMIYMSRNIADQGTTPARFNGLKIHEGDQLEINISAQDAIAISPFQRSTDQKSSAFDSNANTQRATVNSLYTVDSQGNIFFPVLGSLTVVNMTKKQLEGLLETKIGAFVRNPVVSVRLLNFNISILGEVRNPGQYKSETEKLTIFQALALAGDMTDFGDRTHVQLIRHSEPLNQDLVENIDLSDKSILNSPYYYMQQNDVLYVEPDKNKQINANTNDNKTLFFQSGGFLLGIVSLIISLVRK